IVSEEVDKFGAWFRSRGAIPTVVALRQRFEAIRRSELDRLAAGLPARARARVHDITRLIGEKLLLSPTEQLKAIGDAELVLAYSDALTKLFALERQQPAGSEDAKSDMKSKVEPFVRPSHKR